MSAVIRQTRDIATCRSLRRIVFIEEQGVSEAEEVDDQDEDAVHFLLTVGQVPTGSARMILMPDQAKIGRVCVLKAARGQGHGAALIRAAVAAAEDMPGIRLVKLAAQTHALGFYQRLGFAAYGGEFLDAGILHQGMEVPIRR